MRLAANGFDASMRRQSSRSPHLKLLGNRRRRRPEIQKLLPLGEILVESGAITWEELELALICRKDLPPRRFGAMLVQLGLVSERDVAQALARQLELPFIDLASLAPDADAVLNIPRRLAFQHGLVPLRRGDGWIELAMADPTSTQAVDAARAASGASEVRVFVASSSEIARACESAYSLAAS